ncbi:MAG TPA: hypothetical protein VKZ39_00205 [Sphaerochaetaceae bacterium]|nr:hypothetical protein [Sphaerochaetaceae bacterium]
MKNSPHLGELIPLDNSAIIYPPTVARYNTHVFRLSMDLTVEVNPQRLLTALEHVLEQFPYFAVSLHRGFYWYYYLPHHAPLQVYPDSASPCRYIHRKRGANGYQFKVRYTSSRIAVEYFHALTDGTGGLVFLKSLVAEYLKLSGYSVAADNQIKVPGDSVDPEEGEDSFRRFYRPLKSVFGSESKAFHLRSSGDDLTDDVQVISARIAIEDLKRVSAKYQVTITEYLVAQLIDAMQRIQESTVSRVSRYKPIRVSVPVNIRKVFGSKSLRNFTLFIVVGIDPKLGHYEFEEIVKQVMHQMRSGVNAKSLSIQVARNVMGRKHPLIRYAPLIFKNPFMKLLSDSYGDSIYSTVISNIGYVTLPEGMQERVKRVDFHLSPNKTNKVSCGAIGANGSLIFNFSSILEKNTDFEREVLTELVKQGIPVEVYTNRNHKFVKEQ